MTVVNLPLLTLSNLCLEVILHSHTKTPYLDKLFANSAMLFSGICLLKGVDLHTQKFYTKLYNQIINSHLN